MQANFDMAAAGLAARRDPLVTENFHIILTPCPGSHPG